MRALVSFKLQRYCGPTCAKRNSWAIRCILVVKLDRLVSYPPVFIYLRPRKFVSCNGLKKCVFYACFTLIGSWEGGKNLRVGIFLNKNLFG